jgi:hypothetical protein
MDGPDLGKKMFLHPPKPRKNVFVPPAVLTSLSHIAGSMRGMDWVQLYHALDVLLRYFIPCEAFTLYIVEERGKYLRKISPFLEHFPPDLRGSVVDAVADSTLQGSAAITAEACSLPSQSKYATDWATHETTSLAPKPGPVTLDEVTEGRVDMYPPEDWDTNEENLTPGTGGPKVSKVHNVLAWPLKFGSAKGDAEDPYMDYSSADSNLNGADETVFGVIKLTNRLAEKPPQGKQLALARLAKSRSQGKEGSVKHCPFADRDYEFMGSLTELLKALYFAVDPVTFANGSQEQSLEMGREAVSGGEPINAPGQSGPQAGSRTLDMGSGGMFGVLGNAFAKSVQNRKRQAELPEVVARPTLAVTSDSAESIRNAPGWLHKEWLDEDLETVDGGDRQASERRLGGISLLATWTLKQDMVLDPYCAICRFQLKVRRTTRLRPGQAEEVWRICPAFFCVAPDSVTQQYSAFLTEYLQYGESYIVSVRAGSAERWSEWSELSEEIKFEAVPLVPKEPRQYLSVNILPTPGEDQKPKDHFRTKEYVVNFVWEAFASFDPRTPLPIEYCIEAWQRCDENGAGSEEMLKKVRDTQKRNNDETNRPENSTVEWIQSRRKVILHKTSQAIAGQKVEVSIAFRNTSLVPGSDAYFSVKARYMSLPGTFDWSTEMLFTRDPIPSPVVYPAVPVPLPLMSTDYKEAVQSQIGPYIICKWPFNHPATFCPEANGGGWSKGTFQIDVTPSAFPLPYRLQYRVLTKPGERSLDELMQWSRWRELRTYEFIKRSAMKSQPSQRRAARESGGGRTSRALGQGAVDMDESFGDGDVPEAPSGEVVSAELASDVLDAESDGEGCLDLDCDPTGVLGEDWAMIASGLDEATKGGWAVLIQLRWISCRIEGVVSAASAPMCTHVETLPKAPMAALHVLNCSSSSERGQNIAAAKAIEKQPGQAQPIEEEPLGMDEDYTTTATPARGTEKVVHELRNVVHLSWLMVRDSPSFALVQHFEVRYREVPPGVEPEKCDWRSLPLVPLNHATEITSSSATSPREDSPYATLTYTLTSFPFLRFHRYVFSMRLRSKEHPSEWSAASNPLGSVLPVLMPPSRPLPGLALPSHSGSVGDEASAATPELLDSIVCCGDPHDATTWHVELRWYPFCLTDNGENEFPALPSLPVEYQIKYYVISKNPAAADIAPKVNDSKSADALARQREQAVICMEGWVELRDAVASCSIKRSRLPPLGATVRLFLACRCPVLSGPHWSKDAISVDVVLPRQAELPLPMPRQLAWVELQEAGLPMDLDDKIPGTTTGETLHESHFSPGGTWAVIRIPHCPTEFSIAGETGVAADRNLFMFNRHAKGGSGHYVLQYRSHTMGDSHPGAGQHLEDHVWKTVETIKRLRDDGEESLYLVSGFEEAEKRAAEGNVEWAVFRLASFQQSHYSYTSPPMCISTLPAPSLPRTTVQWHDCPSLDGCRVSIRSSCSGLAQSYQLRFRLSSADPASKESWKICEVQHLQPGSLGKGKEFEVEAVVPIELLDYHQEYCYAIRCASPLRWSHWSQDSSPVRLSLEHHGMMPMSKVEQEEKAPVQGFKGLGVTLLGCEERHNYRCPAVDITWPQLTFPEGVWDKESPSPSPELTIEYRVRMRQCVTKHNERVALRQVLCELGVDRRGSTAPAEQVPVISPDPDVSVKDIALRGYQGDCTKFPSDSKLDFSPWQTLTVIPALAPGRDGEAECSYALTFLEKDTTYEVAVDWRWRRLGDAFWMPAYSAIRFDTLPPMPAPPCLRPLSIPVEAWDISTQLSSLCKESFAVFSWPFARPPAGFVSPPSPLGKQLASALETDVLSYGDYGIQCRQNPAKVNDAVWTNCESNFFLLHGKPLCVVKGPWSSTTAAGRISPSEEWVPKPVDTPLPEQFEIRLDELEFRVVRTGDCEVSLASICAVEPVLPPQNMRCMLKLMAPHSTLNLCVRFCGTPAIGVQTAPRAYQIRLTEVGGDEVGDEVGGETRLERVVDIPLERRPEFFVGLRKDVSFLGEKEDPEDRDLLGPEFLGVQGGGEGPQQLPPLEFEHVLSFKELRYGAQYQISVRWISPWRATDWAEPVNVQVSFPRPEASIPKAVLELEEMEPLQLPADLAGDDFLRPMVSDCVQLSWAPFKVPLWGGGQIEYKIEQRSQLRDDAHQSDKVAWQVAGFVLTPIDDSNGCGIDVADRKDSFEEQRVFYQVQELAPSTRYQFRVSARLFVHPKAGFAEEWSQPIESDWYRAAIMAPSPDAPVEAVAPDPPPKEMEKDNTVLIAFPYLPIRESERPENAPPPPAPWILQFRGAKPGPQDPWRSIECTPLDDKRFIVNDSRLADISSEGVVFRLWRCHKQAGQDKHFPDDDDKIRYFGGIVSRPSPPLSVQCPRFQTKPQATLAFGPPSTIVEGSDEKGHRNLPLLLKVSWDVSVLKNEEFAPVRLNQIRYRLTHRPAMEADDPPGGAQQEWNNLEPFEHVCTLANAHVFHEIPVMEPHFLLGCEYELAVRVGTNYRWGSWSPPVAFSLKVEPPKPPPREKVQTEMVCMEDKTTFFKLTWPSFIPHKLSTVVEYRIRMMRQTRFRYAERLTDEMAARSQESIAAQEKYHLVGRVRHNVLRKEGDVDQPSSEEVQTWEFIHDVAADAECGFSFVVDAKHEKCECHFDEEWSKSLESEEVVTPAMDENWFIPKQVPLAMPAGHDVPDYELAFPLVLGHKAHQFNLKAPDNSYLMLYAPWRSSKEASQWPHRIEYTPYIPQRNPVRQLTPQDEDEREIIWYEPNVVEYFDESSLGQSQERQKEEISADGIPLVPTLTVFSYVEGFDLSLWASEQARLGVQMDPSLDPEQIALDGYVRIRVVREGGPEGRHFPSVPSCPLRVRVPRPAFPPTLTPWFVSEKVHAVLWWSCNNIIACEEDKNLDLSMQLHQIRMRRPQTEEDHGWIEAPVSQTRPVVPLLSERSGRQELHMFDILPLLDDISMAQPNKPESLHTQPLGPARDEGVLTYQFSVRVSDGYRWSDWSDPTDPFCFATEPKLVELNASKANVNLNAIKGPEGSVVATPSEGSTPPEFWPHPALEDGNATEELPVWLSVSKVTKRPDGHGPSTKEVESDCLLNQFTVSWPNLSSHSYARPDDGAKNIIRELSQCGLPPYVPAPMLYRLNVWIVGGTASPDDTADRPPSSKDRDCVLYRTYDLPPAAFPEDGEEDDGRKVSNAMKTMSWVIAYLPPDRIYQCTLEGRFRHLNIEWWTPLMRSKEWVSEKIPPPPAPKTLPIRELPTPEYRKLLNRRHPGTTGIVAVQWPWLSEGKTIDAMKNSSHVLEYCESQYRPGLRDSSAPRLAYSGEGVEDRPLGPWREAKAVQIYFAHFGKGIVEYELPHESQYEPNWVPILVASGMYLDNGEDEATFVHLRWRYKAGPRDLALVPTSLHFGNASGPVRTKVVGPTLAPDFHLDCPARKGKVTSWVKWTAWAGSQRYQFSIRLLKKPTKKRGRGGRKSMGRQGTTVSESGDSESEADAPLGEAEGGLEPITGWIELPSITDGFSFSEHPPPDGEGVRPQEEQLLADLKRVIPAREWNDLLFRYYDDREEVFDMGMLTSRQTDGTESAATGATFNVAGSVAGSEAGGRRPRQQGGGGTSIDPVKEDERAGEAPTRTGMVSPASSTTESQSGARKSKLRSAASADEGGGALRKFRIQWGMMVEWRVRVCDECLWSNWSPSSVPAGIMPPMPWFTTPVHITFSRREPTIARIAWGVCALPEEYRHLAPSMEYVVALVTDSQTAKGILQASQGTSSQAQLRAKGIQLTEGTCGIISALELQEGEPQRPKFDPNELFSEGSERRVVGQFTMAESKWIDIPGSEESRAVTGFEVTVSGLKPESVHRFVVRTRCATSGLDELDWRKTTVEPTHPLRWSDPQYTNPVLTPMMPPPLLPPEPVTIPDGKFGRFLHTPCVLLKCALFRKARPDDFDKDHPVVVDVRPAGGLDEDYEQVSSSVYCEIDGYGPCRLVYNLPHLHVELRTRNVIMNEVSAACPSLFAVPPLIVEADKGPDVDLVCKPCGNLFVQLTWQTRCLPGQAPVTSQLGFIRHAVDMTQTHLPSFQMEQHMVLEEIPSNAVMTAAGFKELEDMELAANPPSPYKKVEEQCPFICRHCFMPLCRKAPEDAIGEFGQARLKNLDRCLRASTITQKEVPTYRGWDDDQRHLRAPHKLEVDAKADEERPTLEKAVENYRSLHDPPKVCQCTDVVIRSVLPIDGDKLKYGITYRFLMRVQDRLTWCPWSDVCEPVFLNIPPPKPICPVMNPTKPVSPPAIMVQLVRRDLESDKSGADPNSVTLRLKWTRFEGTLKEVEYRVLMWTLTPDQRTKALEKKPFDLKGRCTLPPIVGVQTVALDVDGPQPTMIEDENPRPILGSELENVGAVPSAKPRGRTHPEDKVPPDGSVAAVARHGSDAPQVIAHLRPFEPPPRQNATRRPGKLPKDKDGAALEGAIREPTTDVDVALLEKGFCYVFGVEAKHSRGVCGNVGEWSAPLFSKAVEFAQAPKHLHVSVNARFGAVVWNHSVATKTNPKDEKISLHAPAVGHVEEHHDLPAAMGMFPAKDPWPLHANPEKYVVRQKGGSVYSDKLKFGTPVKNEFPQPPQPPEPPERGPHHDEKRPH